MKPLPVSLISLLALSAAGSLVAQSTNPDITTSSSRDRSMSTTMASKLAEAMPTYNPPAPEPEPTAEELSASEPKNKILRLPKVIVEGERPPVFSERELHTDAGLADLAMRRYLSEIDRGVLNKFTLPLFGSSNEARALAQFREDERLKNMAATSDQISVLQQTNPDEAKALRDTANDTFIRTPYLPTPSSMNRD